MPLCPKCNKLIDELLFTKSSTSTGQFRGNGYYHTTDAEVDSVSFECPECYETLFNDEDEAEDFLEEVEK